MAICFKSFKNEYRELLDYAIEGKVNFNCNFLVDLSFLLNSSTIKKIDNMLLRGEKENAIACLPTSNNNLVTLIKSLIASSDRVAPTKVYMMFLDHKIDVASRMFNNFDYISSMFTNELHEEYDAILDAQSPSDRLPSDRLACVGVRPSEYMRDNDLDAYNIGFSVHLMDVMTCLLSVFHLSDFIQDNGRVPEEQGEIN